MKRMLALYLMVIVFCSTTMAWAYEDLTITLEFSADEMLELSSREGAWLNVGKREDGGELDLFIPSIIGLEKYYRDKSDIIQPQSYRFLVKQKMNDQETMLTIWELDFSQNRGRIDKVYFVKGKNFEEKNGLAQWFAAKDTEMVRRILKDARYYAGEGNTILSAFIFDFRSSVWSEKAKEAQNWYNVNPFVSKVYLYIPDLLELSKSDWNRGFVFAKIVDDDKVEVFQVEFDMKNQRAREWDTVRMGKTNLFGSEISSVHSDYSVTEWAPISSSPLVRGILQILKSPAMIQTLQNLPLGWEEDVRSWLKISQNPSDWVKIESQFEGETYFQKSSLKKARERYLINSQEELFEIVVKYKRSSNTEVVTKFAIDIKNKKIQPQMMLHLKEEVLVGFSPVIGEWKVKQEGSFLEFIYDELEKKLKE